MKKLFLFFISLNLFTTQQAFSKTKMFINGTKQKINLILDAENNKQIKKSIEPAKSATIKLEDFSHLLRVIISLNYKSYVTCLTSLGWPEIIKSNKNYSFLINFENNKLTMTPCKIVKSFN